MKSVSVVIVWSRTRIYWDKNSFYRFWLFRRWIMIPQAFPKGKLEKILCFFSVDLIYFARVLKSTIATIASFFLSSIVIYYCDFICVLPLWHSHSHLFSFYENLFFFDCPHNLLELEYRKKKKIDIFIIFRSVGVGCCAVVLRVVCHLDEKYARIKNSNNNSTWKKSIKKSNKEKKGINVRWKFYVNRIRIEYILLKHLYSVHSMVFFSLQNFI